MRRYVRAHGRVESRPESKPLAAWLRGHNRRFEARRLVRGRAHRRQPLIPRRRAEAALGGMPRPDGSQPYISAIARAADAEILDPPESPPTTAPRTPGNWRR
jgi:hypothetical protein